MLHKWKWNIPGSGTAISLLVLLVLFMSPYVHAELARRALELELEDVEGVTGYELEVVRILGSGSKKPPVKFKIKSSKWNAKLVPGKYELRVRSLDSRGVPGEWSPAQEFLVKLPPSSVIKPDLNAVIKSSDKDSEKVDFEWKPVLGAEKYKVKVLDKAGAVVEETVESATSATMKLAVAQGYTWQVIPLAPGDLEGEEFEPPPRFELHGPSLEPPQLNEVEDTNTTLITWDPVELAQNYDFVLEKKDAQGQWQSFEHRYQKVPKRTLAKPLPSGQFKLSVRTLADMREPSEFVSKEFTTQNIGARSPAAVEQVKSEGSYGAKSRFFSLASYYITVVQYQGNSADTSTQVRYDAIGGTGRLGAGLWASKDSPWGALIMGDMSGYTLKDETFRYVSGAVLAVNRLRLGALGQLRTSFGAQYRELPVSEGDPILEGSYLQKKIATAGPLLSVSLCHGFTRKIGFQLNAQMTHSTVGLSTPNDKENQAKMSFQAGLLGSLSLTDTLVGFMGYAYRNENAAYGFKDKGLFAAPNQNDVHLTGHYINFMLEYGF